MEQNIITFINECLDNDFIDMILSKAPSEFLISKIKVRTVLLKNQLMYQVSSYEGKQIFHRNYRKEELLVELEQWTNQCMKQVLIRTKLKEHTILISKKGKATINTRVINGEFVKKNSNLNHNREKTYIIAEGEPVPFLVDLGVMTKEGKVVNAKYDKFKQINRYLEFIEDVLPSLDKSKEQTIIDFGCGKSYLTFAMYYYLKIMKGYSIKVIGLDLKKDVIFSCSNLAKKYEFDNLMFLEGDIASFEGVNKVDMVVTLHACDTATDYALAKAVQWGTKVILSVPCCQHELNGQMHNEVLEQVLGYGLIKERIAALATDGIRAELLEIVGYKTQILEFIDMEHTPKNILIRAVKRKDELSLGSQENQNNKNMKKEKLVSYEKLTEFLHVKPMLYQLLDNQNRLSL